MPRLRSTSDCGIIRFTIDLLFGHWLRNLQYWDILVRVIKWLHILSRVGSKYCYMSRLFLKETWCLLRCFTYPVNLICLLTWPFNFFKIFNQSICIVIILSHCSIFLTRHSSHNVHISFTTCSFAITVWQLAPPLVTVLYRQGCFCIAVKIHCVHLYSLDWRCLTHVPINSHARWII